MTLALDAGALIAVERGDAPMVSFLRAVHRAGESIVVPAGVLAQVWRGGPQPLLSRFLRSGVTVEALDEPAARAVGALLRLSGTRDVVDAHVVIVARKHTAVIVTSDPDDLRALDPRAHLHSV